VYRDVLWFRSMVSFYANKRRAVRYDGGCVHLCRGLREQCYVKRSFIGGGARLQVSRICRRTSYFFFAMAMPILRIKREQLNYL